MTQKKKSTLRLDTLLWSIVFVGLTAGALAVSGRGDLTLVGALWGLLLAAAWHLLILTPHHLERSLGRERVKLNLRSLRLDDTRLKRGRFVFAALFLSLWLAVVIPPLTPYGRALASMAERILRREQVVLRVEYPTYLDAQAQEIILKNSSRSAMSSGSPATTPEPALEVDADAYISLAIRFRKSDSNWSVGLSEESGRSSNATIPPTAQYGHSARALLEQLGLDAGKPHTVELTIQKNNAFYARQLLTITPLPRPQVDLSKSTGGPEKEGSVALDVKVRSKIPLAGVEFHVRTASGYRMVKAIAEFANGSEQSFDGKQVPFSTLGIPFSAKDTLFVKAVAKTVAENLFGESQELSFDIVTRESIRQDLIKSLTNSLQALQNSSMSSSALKDTLNQELAKAREAARQLGAQSLATKQTDQISESAGKIEKPRDQAAQKTEKKIKTLLERLKREQTASQMQNLLARLQNLKLSIQRSTPEQLTQLGKDTNELQQSANQLKKQLADIIDKEKSGLTLQEKQAALDALKLDQTPQNLQELERTLADKKQTDAVNQSQTTLEHAQKNLGSVLSLLQQARQRAMRDAREKLTRADGDLQNARRSEGNSKDALRRSQQELDALPDISNEFQDAARDAQKGNQKARQGAQSGNDPQMEAGIDEAQDGIVRALAALQDEEEAERQSQQEQDGQNSRNNQEALAAQGQLDMGWRRQILEEIARLRAAGESSDSPAIKYLESRLR
jgi:hypothetical protein